MDHAIEDLVSRMDATIDMHKDDVPMEELKPEIKAYVKAVNELEKYYYGEKKTRLETILSLHE